MVRGRYEDGAWNSSLAGHHNQKSKERDEQEREKLEIVMGVTPGSLTTVKTDTKMFWRGVETSWKYYLEIRLLNWLTLDLK